MLQKFLADIPVEVLKRTKSIDLNINSETCNQEINKLLQRTVLLGGKRLRPLLTLLMGKCLGVNLDILETYASAIEMVHAASLAHDDVIDNAQTRRGKASINVQSSNQKAVLAGDYLLAYVIRMLTEAGNFRLVSEMSKVIGQLAEGEWLQLDLIKDKNYTKDKVRKVAEFKTSSVMSWCTTCPGILAELNDNEIESLRKLGLHLGLAFQLIDDTLDYSDQSFKDLNLDLQNGIVNSVTMNWFDRNPEEFKKFQKNEMSLVEIDKIALKKACEEIKHEAKNHLGICYQLTNDLAQNISNQKIKESFTHNKNALSYIYRYLEKRIF
ncbi:MAG: polyprenyl synthetase family protein [Halobacteriovoraceae bacterium]|nr:polyprenyl synthetase family protein [Halobacteriovoraceae bacterium]